MSKNKKSEKAFDRLVWLVSVAYPLTALPQIIKVYATQSANDLSIWSWVLYVILESVLLVYAIRKRLTPIIVQDVMWLIVYIVLVVAILLYG